MQAARVKSGNVVQGEDDEAVLRKRMEGEPWLDLVGRRQVGMRG